MADKYNLGTVGGGMIIKELFSGSVGSLTSAGAGKITLNDNITNYKFLIFDFYCSDGGMGKRYYSRFISVQQFTNFFNSADTASTTMSFNWGYGNLTDYFDILYNGTTTKVLNIIYNYTQCLRILGIN